MSRRPQPGGDRNAWGRILNDHLSVSINEDGTIKPGGVSNAVTTEVETALAVQLPPAVAQEVAAQPTVAAAAAAAVDAEPRISSLISDVADVDDRVTANIVTTDVLAALRFDPEHPNYGAVRGSRSVEPDALTKAANRAAIQLAADDAHSAGGTLVIKGAYWIDDTIQIRCHVDGASGELLVSDTSISPAVLVGDYQNSTMLHNKHIVLPGIRQMGKTGTGWSGNDTGLIIGNTYSCHITVTGIHNFSNGMRATSYSTGNVYNNVYLGIFENNKVGLDITTENSGGWTNETVWIGGRFHINSAEGTNIPGARHIRIQATLYSNNNHLFLSPSIEGNGPEYHAELGGNNNTIIQGRWEASPPKVLWGANADSNVIYQGWGAYQIQTTGGAVNCRITSRQSDRWFAGGGSSGLMHLLNQSSTNSPVITIMPALSGSWSLDPATQYGMQLGARYTRWKRSTDDHDRITVDAEQGRILFGQGDVAPTTYLAESVFGGMVIVSPGNAIRTGSTSPIMPQGVGPTVMAGTGDPNGSATASPGSIYLRSNGTIYRKSTGTGNTGWVTMS